MISKCYGNAVSLVQQLVAQIQLVNLSTSLILSRTNDVLFSMGSYVRKGSAPILLLSY